MLPSPKSKDPAILKIGGIKVARGERKSFFLDSAALYDYTQLKIPVEVIRGVRPGPVLFISAAVHGDEINGIEVVRKLLKRKALQKINGTLILIPIVNVFGFNYKSRYLPDRRDLNRSFPGKKTGSLASQLAYTFMKEIVSKCTHGIDLHTGANHRTNLPHIRAYLDDRDTRELAKGFGVPVIINSKLRDGSLRESARKKDVKILLFEGGEALRFDDKVIRTAMNGCLSVMKKIGMLNSSLTQKVRPNVFIAESSFWVRATRSGLASFRKKIGDKVKAGEVLAVISDPFGREKSEVISDEDGILVGSSLIPLVNKGDAMFHIATFHCSLSVKEALTLHDSISIT